MIKCRSMFILTFVFLLTVVHSQFSNETGEDRSLLLLRFVSLSSVDSPENFTELITLPKPFVYYGRYHRRRFRRESSSKSVPSNPGGTGSTILSILPLDRLGTLIGQIMATGLKEMLNPNVGKKIVNIIENQGPSLLTSLFTNLYSTLRVPGRSSSNHTNSFNTKYASKQLSNSSVFFSTSINSKRRPRIK